ncbi:MAG: PocR ligand-binding domain-containing protein [Clostridia bacterium]
MEFNKAKLMEVLEAFYRTTNARVAIYDDKFNEVEAYPQSACKLCEKLRQNKEIDKLCKQSDKIAFAKVQAEKTRYIYQCKMGMYESVAPIMLQGNLIGYVMMGQVLTLSGKNVLREKLEKYDVDKAEFSKIIENSQTIPSDKLSSIGLLMSICVEYLCSQKGINEEFNGKVQTIEKYITDNLSRKITIGEIQEKFKISRAALYKMYMKNFNEPPSAHINALKMQKAVECVKLGLSTDEICVKVGIDDKNYLSRIFKKYNKMTIGDYRFMCQIDN